MRLVIDMSVLRQAPHAGTARYAREVRAAMAAAAAPGDQLLAVGGWPRWRSTNRLRPVRRVVNLGAEISWLAGGALAAAVRGGADAWFGPANVLPLALPRPKVVTIHDLNFIAAPGTYDRGYARYAERVFRLAARRAACVVASSKATRDQVVSLLGVDPGRVRVIYPGVDHLTRVTPARGGSDLPDRYALFVGQTEPHKNVGLLLEAWRAGVPRDLHLVICGPPGRDDERLRRAAGASDLRDRVHFLGLLDEAELARAYSGARLFVCPSLAEGFGFPPLEAMARGIPSAVSTAGSLPEVTADGALHFDPHDAAGLAAIVIRLADDPGLRSQLVARGQDVAARYTWAATAAALWQAARHAAAH